MLAVKGCRLEIVNQMIERGANDQNGTIMAVARGGHQEIIKILIDAAIN